MPQYTTNANPATWISHPIGGTLYLRSLTVYSNVLEVEYERHLRCSLAANHTVSALLYLNVGWIDPGTCGMRRSGERCTEKV